MSEGPRRFYKPKEAQLTRRVQIVTTTAEWELWREAANQAGVSVSAWLRMLAKEASMQKKRG